MASDIGIYVYTDKMFVMTVNKLERTLHVKRLKRNKPQIEL